MGRYARILPNGVDRYHLWVLVDCVEKGSHRPVERRLNPVTSPNARHARLMFDTVDDSLWVFVKALTLKSVGSVHPDQ